MRPECASRSDVPEISGHIGFENDESLLGGALGSHDSDRWCLHAGKSELSSKKSSHNRREGSHLDFRTTNDFMLMVCGHKNSADTKCAFCFGCRALASRHADPPHETYYAYTSICKKPGPALMFCGGPRATLSTPRFEQLATFHSVAMPRIQQPLWRPKKSCHQLVVALELQPYTTNPCTPRPRMRKSDHCLTLCG